MMFELMRHLAGLPIFLALLPSYASVQGDPTFGYMLERDVVYGQGCIAPQGTEVMRDLKIDVYAPLEAGTGYDFRLATGSSTFWTSI